MEKEILKVHQLISDITPSTDVQNIDELVRRKKSGRRTEELVCLLSAGVPIVSTVRYEDKRHYIHSVSKTTASGMVGHSGGPVGEYSLSAGISPDSSSVNPSVKLTGLKTNKLPVREAISSESSQGMLHNNKPHSRLSDLPFTINGPSALRENRADKPLKNVSAATENMSIASQAPENETLYQPLSRDLSGGMLYRDKPLKNVSVATENVSTASLAPEHHMLDLPSATSEAQGVKGVNIFKTYTSKFMSPSGAPTGPVNVRKMTAKPEDNIPADESDTENPLSAAPLISENLARVDVMSATPQPAPKPLKANETPVHSDSVEYTDISDGDTSLTYTFKSWGNDKNVVILQRSDGIFNLMASDNQVAAVLSQSNDREDIFLTVTDGHQNNSHKDESQDDDEERE